MLIVRSSDIAEAFGDTSYDTANNTVRDIECQFEDELPSDEVAQDDTQRDQPNQNNQNRVGYNLRSRDPINYTELSEVHITEQMEPITYQEAVHSPQRDNWHKAMTSEYESLLNNKTWEIVPLPVGCKPIGCRWVFKLKTKGNRISRYKARLVAKGFTQKHGIDYKETFSPVVKMDSVRILLTLATQYDWELIQVDIKTAFLYGELEKTIYMSQLEGFEVGSGVCKLHKAIYGLKQASRQWNKRFSSFLYRYKLKQLSSDSCVFVNNFVDRNNVLIISIYVDDGLLMSAYKNLLSQCVEYLRSEFEMTVNEPDTYVGLQIQRDRRRGRMFIHQRDHITRVIERYVMKTRMRTYNLETYK